MIPKEWLDVLRIGHGAYNAIIALAFVYQGWLGLKIRRERKAAGARDFDVVRRAPQQGAAPGDCWVSSAMLRAPR